MTATSYNEALVTFSFLIGTIASYVALGFSQRARSVAGPAGAPWLAASALTMALGIWTMHFVGMLALDLDIWIWYSVSRTALSFIPALVLSAMAFFALDSDDGSPALRLASATFLASAIVGSQLVAFSGVRTGGTVHMSQTSVVAGAAVGSLLCIGALQLAARLRTLRTFELRTALFRAGAAALLGAAMCATHFITLAGTEFTGGAQGWRPPFENAVGTTGIGFAVALTTMVILATGVGMSEIDRWRLGRLVTEESIRRSEGLIQQSERRFRSIIENSSDFTTIVSSTGIIRYASPGFARFVGQDGLEGTDMSRHVHKGDRERFEEALRSLAGTADGARTAFEYRITRADRQWRRFATEATNLLGDPAVEGIVLNSRDVTERQTLEDQLRQSQKMDAVGKLAAGVAHDFNNILTVITSSSEFLVADLPPDSRQYRDATEIREASDRAAALTRQLLTFSRKQLLEPAAIDLSEVVARMIPMIKRVINEDIEIVTRQNTRGQRILADNGQMEQVVLNLVLNARDAMPSGGVLIIDTCVAEHNAVLEQRGIGGPFVSLEVSDTGVGMTEEVRRQVFDPFFTTKDREKGTGLGLATVYGIVTHSDGHIECRSEPGKGTTFTITFAATDAVAAVAAPEKHGEFHGSGQVLLVEDEADVRRVARRVLERIGYEVIEASNGEEAVALAEANRATLTLVVSDVVMPGLDGPSMVRVLRERMPGLPVLFVSGYSDQELQRRRLDLDAPFVAKPFSEQQLAEAAALAIARHGRA